MSVIKGKIKYTVYRGNTEKRVLIMQNKVAGVTSATDVNAVFSNIELQIRTGDNPKANLIKSLSLAEGTITVTDTNVLNFDLALDVPAGVYYYDVKYTLSATGEIQTYLKNVVIVEEKVSR